MSLSLGQVFRKLCSSKSRSCVCEETSTSLYNPYPAWFILALCQGPFLLGFVKKMASWGRGEGGSPALEPVFSSYPVDLTHCSSPTFSAFMDWKNRNYHCKAFPAHRGGGLASPRISRAFPWPLKSDSAAAPGERGLELGLSLWGLGLSSDRILKYSEHYQGWLFPFLTEEAGGDRLISEE